MIKKLIAAVVVLSFGLVASATTVETNGTEVTITADAAYTYTERIDSAITKLTITASTSNLVTLVACDDSFTGNVSLEGKAYLGFNATTFAGSTATDNATLTLGNGTCVWFNGVIKQPNEIPWKLVVPSGSLAYIRTTTNYDDGSDSAKKANHWRGSVEVAGELRVYGTGSAYFYGYGKHSYLWFDGTISGAGKICSYTQPDATIGHSNEMLAFGNAATEKRIAKFQVYFGPVLLFDAGDFRKTATDDLAIFRDQDPNVHVNLSVVGKSALTSAGAIKIQRCGGLDIFDGAAVTGAVLVAGDDNNTQYGTLYVKNGGSLYWKANPTAGAYNFIGKMDGSDTFKPTSRSGMPANGFVYMEGANSSIYNEGSLFFGQRSRGYYEQRGGTFTSKPGARIVLADARGRNVPESASHAQMMISGGAFTADQIFLCGVQNDSSNWVGGFADLTVKGAGTVMTVDTITAQVQRERQAGYPTDGTGRGTTSFVNIKSGAVLAAKHIMRGTGGNNWRDIFNSKKTYMMSKWYMNFDGGTVKPLEAGEFFASSNGDTTVSWRIPDRATVYAGGATIDTDGRDVSWSAPLLKPSGKSLDLSLTAFTYPAIDPATGKAPVKSRHGPARVRVLYRPEDDPNDNKYATSASLWATTTAADMRNYGFNGVEVTAPGNDLPDQVLVVADDYMNVPSLTNTVATVAAATTGGFTKKGAGTLTLKGENTWGGTTRIEAGALAFTHAQGLPANSTVEIASSALANGMVPLRVKAYTGGEIHIVGATLDDAWLQKPTKVLVSETALTSIPTVKLYGAGDTKLDTDEWVLNLSSDGKALWFGREPTKDLTIANPDIVRGSIDVIGTFAVTNDEIVTVTATPNNHALVGWNVDGEFVAAGDHLTYDYRANLSKATLSLSPVFSTNLYVNAKAGNDEGDGMTPGTAKKTLAAIAANAVSGDTIHAAPGTYSEGHSDLNANYASFVSSVSGTHRPIANARVLLNEGVSLVSDEGAAVTTIVGLADPNGEYWGADYNYLTSGCGTNALRCVAARANTYLKGFLLKDGYTRAVTGGPDDANGGGCVIAKPYNTSRADTLLVEDCIIQNGHARSGCCVYGGFYNRCVIKNGTSFSSSGPGGAHTARLVNCVVWQDNNTCSSVRSVRGIYNSLIYAKKATSEGDLTGSSETYPIVNSVLVTEGAREKYGPVELTHVKNCYMCLLSDRVTLDDETCAGNTIVGNYNDFGFNSSEPPTGLLPHSPLIDKGDSSLFDPDTSSGLDVNGNQRIFNAKVDVGPFEFDWRPVYAADLKASDITVTEASPEVVETSEKNVRLVDGAAVAMTWPGEGESHVVRYEVEGEGTLTMTDENGSATSITESGYKIVSETTPGSALTFTFAGTGNAKLTTFGLVKAAVHIESVNGAVEPSGDIEVDLGKPFTVTANATRPFVRLEVTVNGVRQEIADGVRSYTWTPTSIMDTLSVKAIYDTHWYVDPTKSDDNTGFTPGAAKKTLAVIGAMAVSGDTIHAAAGTYNEGTTNQPSSIAVDNTKSPSRIVLAAGVTLVADEGPEKTIINGVPTKGPEGVRCVAAYGGTTIRGFTLRNGATSSETAGGERDWNLGGCVLAPKATSRAATCFIDNCIISGGKARTGGCVAGGYLHRCSVSLGQSGAGCSLAQYAVLDHCVLYGNSNSATRNHYGIYSTLLINVDVGDTYYDMSPVGSAPVENSIIALQNTQTKIADGTVYKNMKNCIWNIGGNVVKIDDATCKNVITCHIASATLTSVLSTLKLGSDYRPLAGSPVIDAGDNAFLADVFDGTTDLDGLQRIWNGLVDIGPYEYNFTNEYTAAVCGKRAKVTGASEMVATNATGEIVIPAGGSLSIDWKGREGRAKKVKLTVSALTEGSLLVYKGDMLVETITETGTFEVESAAALTNLRLVAEGGTATVSAVKPDLYGTLMILQ